MRLWLLLEPSKAEVDESFRRSRAATWTRSCERGGRRGCLRRGTAAVEFALALPVLLAFVFGLVECSRIRMTTNLLGAACRLAARHGSAEGVTSQDACEHAARILATGMNPEHVVVLVKDAAVYDGAGALPASGAELSTLPDIELADAESRQMFLVRASVAYNDIALVPLPVMQGAVLTGQAFMRHE